MYVWERSGKVWFKDPGDTSFTLLLDISEEVGDWQDYGMAGFALDPAFRSNGYIYVLYVVDRYYLLNFGLPGYNPNSNDYNSATIGRLTRYTCTSSNSFRSVDLSSRLILIGQSKTNGFPICSYTHGVGSLVFGQDGTLLVSCGDGATASAVDEGGGATGSYAPQAASDGILRPEEDIGAYRAQLVDCLGGKILRIDPATGNGLPSNPFYDAANPKSARSRVWTLGLRNPFRMTLRPNSGSDFPADGRPGVLYVGNVGWDDWEALKVVTGPGQNFGWPVFEGLQYPSRYTGTVYNLDAPNPLYPASGCSQYFAFTDLLKEDTLNSSGQPPFVNPCNTSQRIPSSIPQFLHTRPALDWNHASAITRTPTYGGSGQAQTANVGAPGSPVSGTQFQGNCSVGGTWYTCSNFPAQYQNTYFHADWGQGWIKNMVFDQNDKPVAVNDFLSSGGSIVSVVQHVPDGSLYYISYDYNSATVRQLSYTGNRAPVAVASADHYYGPGPLTVQFSSSGSGDPDLGQSITYSWNFGDGSPLSTAANPSHTFNASGGVPTGYTVTLTVTDNGGLSAQTSLKVAANDTPPNVTITSPIDGSLYNPNTSTIVNLTATVSDAESSDGQLSYRWQTLLHHNDHNHSNPVDTNHVTTTVISPTGCDGINIFYYRIILTVTDSSGLATSREVRLFPDCGPNTPPSISDIPNQTTTIGGIMGPVGFTIGDSGAAAANLQLSATSSNLTLVPISNIAFGGSGSNRTVTVTPAAGQSGTSLITVSVTDGPLTNSDSFLLTVSGFGPSGTKSFTNAAALSIPSIGASTPYPSSIYVFGLGGNISNMTVRLNGFSHTYGNDVDMLLVGPGGQAIRLMENTGTGPTVNANLAFSDSAAAILPVTGALSSGTYKPTAYSPSTTYPSPAPAGPYGTTLSTFNGLSGLSVTGNWLLYVLDDGAGDSGSLAGGWSLSITTVGNGLQSPTISDIGNRSTTVNTPTAAIPFTVGDPDTPLGNLTLSGGSSNTLLVPTNNIAFGGSGSNRTVTVTPAAGQTGTSTITVTVSDGANSASDTFLLTVSAVNTPPTITGVANQSINEDTPTAALSFTVGDAETAAGSLTLSGDSSNTGVAPTNNIVFGGSGANRTVTVSPAANQSGTATITLSVSDGQYVTSTNFVLTVNPVNDPPTITGIANQTINVGATAGPLSFTIGDIDTSLTSLTLSRASSNTTLVPTNSIVFGGSGSNRTVTVTPTAGQTGTSTITVGVNDGQYTTNTSFVLTVSTLFTGTLSFTNTGAITIPSVGNATPYPSAITVSGMGGAISNVTVTLRNLSHTYPADVDILLVGPTGQNAMIFSDVGGGGDINNVTVTLSDSAATALTATGQIVSGTYKPTDVEPGDRGELDTFSAPAPAGPYAAPLSVFNGSSPNGTWSLYVVDDGPGDQGSIGSGWSLTITTAGTSQQTPVITWTNPVAMTYGTALGAAQLNASANVPGTFAYSPAAGTVLNASNNQVLSVTFTPTDTQNYRSATNTVLINVQKAPLTITADDQTRMIGQTNPLFTATYNGFVNGENSSSLDVPVNLTTTATVSSPAGTYPIVASGATDIDYTITFSDGVLTVTNPPPPQITAIVIDAQDLIHLTVTGEIGVRYGLETSGDLVDWSQVDVQNNTTGSVEFVEPPMTNSMQFFRAQSMPP